MKFRPYWIVLGLAVYLPFEDFLLKWLPVSDQLYSVARLGSEVVIYGLFVLIVLDRLWRGLPLRKTPIDLWVATFVCLAALSAFLNQASMEEWVLNFKALNRYIFLYYIVVNLSVNEREISVTLKYILGIGMAEAFLAVAQYFIGGAFNDIFLPRETVEIAGYQRTWLVYDGGLKIGSVMGTLGTPGTLGLFLVLCTIILSVNQRLEDKPANRKFYWLFLLLAVGSLFTYSKAATLFVLLAPFLVLSMVYKKRAVQYAIGGGTLLSIVFLLSLVGDGKWMNPKEEALSPIQNLDFLFNQSYWENVSEVSRGWVIQEVGGALLSSVNLFGYSADKNVVRHKIVKEHRALSRLMHYKPFEDVYWIAMLAYYGMIGLMLYLIVLYKLFSSAKRLWKRTEEDMKKKIGLVFCTLTLVAIPYNFIERVFEIRTFSFYFWLLAGLSMSEYLRSMPQRERVT